MANGSTKFLQYRPIDKSITPHPASIVQPKKKSSYSRQGKAHERKIVTASDLIRAHYASGSVAGKGDAYWDIPMIGRVNIEIKTRFKNFIGRCVPTAAEIREGRNQSVQMWMISSKKPYEKDVVFMEYKLWSKILMNFLLHPKVASLDLPDRSIKYAINNGIPQSIYQHYEKVKRGVKPKFNHSNWQSVFNVSVIDTKYGKFAMANNDSFSKFMHVYTRLLIDR